MGNGEITAVLLGNAGVLMQYNGVKLLIDGIYYDRSGFFSNVPDILSERLLRGQGCFQDIDYFLFSHDHSDHFDRRRIMECLAHQAPKLVILPAEGSADTGALLTHLKRNQIPCAALSNCGYGSQDDLWGRSYCNDCGDRGGQGGRSRRNDCGGRGSQGDRSCRNDCGGQGGQGGRSRRNDCGGQGGQGGRSRRNDYGDRSDCRGQVLSLEKNIFVTALSTVHMGNQYAGISHFSYLISISTEHMGMKHILFLADAECNESCLRSLEQVPIDSVFVTPLFFHSRVGRDILRSILCPRQVVIYHLPFEGQDRNGYIKMARRDIERDQSADWMVDLFCEAGQVMVLGKGSKGAFTNTSVDVDR